MLALKDNLVQTEFFWEWPKYIESGQKAFEVSENADNLVFWIHQRVLVLPLAFPIAFDVEKSGCFFPEWQPSKIISLSVLPTTKQCRTLIWKISQVKQNIFFDLAKVIFVLLFANIATKHQRGTNTLPWIKHSNMIFQFTWLVLPN